MSKVVAILEVDDSVVNGDLEEHVRTELGWVENSGISPTIITTEPEGTIKKLSLMTREELNTEIRSLETLSHTYWTPLLRIRLQLVRSELLGRK